MLMTYWSETCFCWPIFWSQTKHSIYPDRRHWVHTHKCTHTPSLLFRIHNRSHLCSIMHRKSFIFFLHMHYTLQQRIADEGIVTGLFQGYSFTLAVCGSHVLIYTAQGPCVTSLLHSLYSVEGLQTDAD